MAVFFNTHSVNIIDEINEKVFMNRKDVMSISKVISLSKKQFDKEGMSKHCFEKYYNDPNSKYYHKTADQIKEEWNQKSKSATTHGIKLDDISKLYLTNTDFDIVRKQASKDIETANLNGDGEKVTMLYLGFDRCIRMLWEHYGSALEYCDREKYVYYTTKHGNIVRGRFDALFYDKSKKKYILFDWKNSATIKTNNKWQKMTNPYCSFLDDCNFNDYSIQLNFYKKALIETYNLGNDISTFVVQIPGKNLNENISGLQPMLYRFYSVEEGIIYNNMDNIIDECCL